MRRLTLRELDEKFGGVLPPDAVLRPDDGEELARPDPPPSRSPARRSAAKRKPNRVVAKLLGYRRFFDSLADLDPPLTPGAVALWCWLWSCERKGVALSTARRVAARLGFSVSTAKRRLAELRRAGFVVTVRAGLPNRSASLLRVRCSPKKRKKKEREMGPPVTRDGSTGDTQNTYSVGVGA